MPQKTGMSKGLAVVFGVLTVSAIAGMISMIIVFKVETAGMNMTARPIITTTTANPPVDMRLPRNLVPEHYDIQIQLHLYTRIVEEVNVTTPNQTLLFTGNSTVRFYCEQGTRHLYLHTGDQTLSDPRVTNADTGASIGVADMSVDYESDFLAIELKESLETGGNYSLFLSFQGNISENLQTLYVSQYTETDLSAENETIAER